MRGPKVSGGQPLESLSQAQLIQKVRDLNRELDANVTALERSRANFITLRNESTLKDATIEELQNKIQREYDQHSRFIYYLSE
jgi:hypothetical protein